MNEQNTMIKNEEVVNPTPKPPEKPTALEIDGKPITVDEIKAMQSKVQELTKTATSLESTKKERDDAMKELTELRTKQSTLESMLGGGKPKEVDVMSGEVPDMFVEVNGEVDINPQWTAYQAQIGKTMREMREEILQLRKIAGVTGAQNVNHGNAIVKMTYQTANKLTDEEMNDIIKVGVDAKLIPTVKIGERNEPVLNDIDILEQAKTLKLVKSLTDASKKKDMKEIQKLIQDNFVTRTDQSAPRLGGGGDADKTDAEKKFQLYAAQKIDIKDFTEPEIDELIRKGFMSQNTKKYRWALAQTKT